MLQEARNIKIRKVEGKYEYDNPDLEYKNKWVKKVEKLEEKYKDMPKIAFHELDDTGNLKFMQVKRDRVWTTLGWSAIGNIAGVGVVRYIEKNSDKWNSLRQFRRRELLKVGGFVGVVGLFTLYGYGNAQQHFIKEKVKIVDEHSVRVSGK